MPRAAARRCATASWRPRWTRPAASAPTRARSARRCWRCVPARAWCSTRPTTTPGASGRSSPIRWSHRRSTSGWPAAIDGPVPHYPAPDGVKLAAGWLVERAGFGKGYPDDDPDREAPLPAVHQARACVDQPRRRHRRGRGGPGPHRPRRGPGCVWHHTQTRAVCWSGARCSCYFRAEAPRQHAPVQPRSGSAAGREACRFSPGIFDCREHIQRPPKTGADQPAPGFGGPGARRVRSQRVGRLRRQVDQASRRRSQAPAAHLKFRPADAATDVVPDRADQRRGQRRLVPARRIDQLVGQGRRRARSTRIAPSTRSPSRWATTRPTPGAVRPSATTARRSR